MADSHGILAARKQRASGPRRGKDMLYSGKVLLKVTGMCALLLLAGAALVALILTFGPISGAHFNPAVTLADASQKGLPWSEVPAYVAAQFAGAFGGVAAANVMFRDPSSLCPGMPAPGAQLFSEFVATFGLLSVIWGCVRLRSSAVPFAVGAYIAAAYWFTSSTSFANPAVTLARCASDTFAAGIRPLDASGFIAAQLCGAAAATLLFRWLVPSLPKDASDVLVPHRPENGGAR